MNCKESWNDMDTEWIRIPEKGHLQDPKQDNQAILKDPVRVVNSFGSVTIQSFPFFLLVAASSYKPRCKMLKSQFSRKYLKLGISLFNCK